MSWGFSLNTSASVRVDGRRQQRTQHVWLMSTNATYLTSPVPPILPSPATILRALSTVVPALLVTSFIHQMYRDLIRSFNAKILALTLLMMRQVGREMATAVRMWTNA